MKKIFIFSIMIYSMSLFAQSSQEVAWSIPKDWEYPVGHFGPPEIFRLYDVPGDDDSVMEIYSHKNAAILAKNISTPLEEDTVIKWNWRVDRIPSPVAEDTAETHDYISVAVLFDNGQDISYVWSRELPEGKGFRCPLPDWEARETHVIIRSGEAELMQWMSESRNLKNDYERYIGGELPGNIEQVWLITVTIFQGGTAKATVKDIFIESRQNQLNEEVL